MSSHSDRRERDDRRERGDRNARGRDESDSKRQRTDHMSGPRRARAGQPESGSSALSDELLVYLQPTSEDAAKLEAMQICSLKSLFEAVLATCRDQIRTGLPGVIAVPRGMLLLWLRKHLSNSSRLQQQEAVADGVLVVGGQRPKEYIGYRDVAYRGTVQQPQHEMGGLPHDSGSSRMALPSYAPAPPPPPQYAGFSIRDAEFLAELEGPGSGVQDDTLLSERDAAFLRELEAPVGGVYPVGTGVYPVGGAGGRGPVRRYSSQQQQQQQHPRR